MGKWKQISGDVNWDKYGCLLARVNTNGRDVDLVRIEPWLEHDSSALRTHGLWLVDHGTVDYSDMGVDSRDVQGAIQTAGVDAAEYKKLPVEGKAQVIVEYRGLGGESRSVNDLMEALPDKPENITFWHGKETADSIRNANTEMRREALDSGKLFKTSGRFPKLPEDEALEFILADDEWEFNLDDNAVAGLGYAQLFGAPSVDLDKKSGKLTIRSPREFAKIVRSLSEAPLAKEVGPSKHHLIEKYLGWTDTNKSDDMSRDEAADELAESAHEAAENLLSEIGFSWRY